MVSKEHLTPQGLQETYGSPQPPLPHIIRHIYFITYPITYLSLSNPPRPLVHSEIQAHINLSHDHLPSTCTPASQLPSHIVIPGISRFPVNHWYLGSQVLFQ